MDFVDVIRSVNLTNPSWDLFVFVTFAAGVYLCVFRFGKDRAFMTLLCGYVALAFMGKLAMIEKVLGVNLKDNLADKAVLFLLMVLALSWIFSHSDFVSVFKRGFKHSRFQALVMSFLTIGFIVSVVISFVSPIEARSLSIFLKTCFVDSEAQFFWLVSPLVATFLLKDN